MDWDELEEWLERRLTLRELELGKMEVPSDSDADSDPESKVRFLSIFGKCFFNLMYNLGGGDPVSQLSRSGPVF